MLKVLLAGESWVSHTTHIKGMDVFQTCTYEEGGRWLISAWESAGIAVDYIPNHLAPDRFPFALEELGAYDAVILSDIGSNTLLLNDDVFVRGRTRPNRLELLRDYVERGGGLGMIGGYLSFMGIDAKARYGQTALAKVLPVDMLNCDDRQETSEGARPQIVASGHPVLEGITGPWPLFLGYNRTVAQERAQVVATIGGDPFLVVGEYGKGRTAAFTSDCSPHWGTEEFVHWDCYERVWVNLVRYLAGEIG